MNATPLVTTGVIIAVTKRVSQRTIVLACFIIVADARSSDEKDSQFTCSLSAVRNVRQSWRVSDER